MDLIELAMDEIYPIEEDISLAGAVLGGVFEHTYELKVIKYYEAMKRKDCEKW